MILTWYFLVSFDVVGPTEKVVVAGFILEWTPLVTNWLNKLLNQQLPAKTQQFFLIYCNVTGEPNMSKLKKI